MNEFILVVGFREDTDSICKGVQSGLNQIDSNMAVKGFTSKWELENWLDENSSIIIHSQKFRHDSRIFFNGDIFANRTDYEDTFFWNKYYSKNIKLFIIASSTRELEEGSADIVYDNLEFCKQILPKTPKIILDFVDGKFCDPPEIAYIDLIKHYQASVYHVKRDTTSLETTKHSNDQLSEFVKRLVKCNYNIMMESYLRVIQS